MTAESPTTDSWLSVFAPATVSNVGPGFDCFGFALEQPGDVVRVRTSPIPGVRIVEITGDDGALPWETARNTAAVAAARIWSRHPGLSDTRGLELRIEKGIPPGSGIGSSAASAVAGGEAAMRLAEREAGAEYDGDAVLDAALSGEAVASGSRHADNAAPCLLGGFTIVQSTDPPCVARFVPALECRVGVVKPDIAISTKEARAVLPEQVPLVEAVTNWSNASALVLGLLRGDRDIVERSLVDEIVEPHRARLIPGAGKARRAAREAGAFAAAVSGAGPAMFLLADSDEIATAAVTAMAQVFEAEGLSCLTTVGPISTTGARVL